MLARLTAALCSLVLLAAVALGAYEYGTRSAGPHVAAQSSGGPLDFLEEIITELDRESVRAPDQQKLVDGAVRGMFKELGDDYAKYYDQDAFDELNASLDGGFSGIGVEIQEEPKGIVIMTVFDDTPAKRAGLETGERIVSVDGEDIRDKPIDAVVDRIKGDEGTDVTLGLAGGSEGRREVTLTRERIELPIVTSRMLGDDAGYVRMIQFTSGVGDDIRTTVSNLVEKGAEGIVLDLRSNPGGLLNEAISVGSVFIEDGEIVSVKERGNSRRAYNAKGDALEDLPLVVLVDKGSASASEIVAGALQDAGRATIIGETTYGKGTVQTIHKLDAGGGVKFTTAEYFTPSGDSIEDVGVKPDRVVKDSEPEDERDEQLAAARKALRALIAGGESTGG